MDWHGGASPINHTPLITLENSSNDAPNLIQINEFNFAMFIICKIAEPKRSLNRLCKFELANDRKHNWICLDRRLLVWRNV